MSHPPQVLMIGGGMIGIKTTEALLARGIKVAIVELAAHVLSTALDATLLTF